MKIFPEVEADAGVIEVGGTVSVSGMVYAMSDSVADPWVASGDIAVGARQCVMFNAWFFEATSVTVTGR